MSLQSTQPSASFLRITLLFLTLSVLAMGFSVYSFYQIQRQSLAEQDELARKIDLLEQRLAGAGAPSPSGNYLNERMQSAPARPVEAPPVDAPQMPASEMPASEMQAPDQQQPAQEQPVQPAPEQAPEAATPPQADAAPQQ